MSRINRDPAEKRKMKPVCESKNSDRLVEQAVADAVEQYQGISLIKLTLDAVQAVDCTALDQEDGRNGDTNPRTVLTIISYCYAVGIYQPENIVDSIEEDPAIAYLAARTLPSASVVRHFRRHHRGLIREVMMRLYERVWVMNLLGQNVPAMNSMEIGHVVATAQTHPLILSRLGQLAEERILLALLWDGPALRD